MALAGNLPITEAQERHGLIVDIHPDAPSVLAPIAPGLIVPIGVRRYTALALGAQQEIARGPCIIALDGEREVTVRPGERASVRLNPQGPRVINPHHVLAAAAQQGVFVQPQVSSAL
jgi:hypothetical protein